MDRTFRSAWLNILLIAAFVFAGISPACKFISGQTSLIEICTSEGIKLVAEQAPPANEANDTKDHDHKKPEHCAFCFSSAKIKIASAPPPEFETSRIAGAILPPVSENDPADKNGSSPFSARAPPRPLIV
jgi:hypothetical protein